MLLKLVLRVTWYFFRWSRWLSIFGLQYKTLSFVFQIMCAFPTRICTAFPHFICNNWYSVALQASNQSVNAATHFVPRQWTSINLFNEFVLRESIVRVWNIRPSTGCIPSKRDHYELSWLRLQLWCDWSSIADCAIRRCSKLQFARLVDRQKNIRVLRANAAYAGPIGRSGSKLCKINQKKMCLAWIAKAP